MELQYAIFCENVQFPDKPQGAIVLTKPLSNLIVGGVDELEFPLFVTFVNGASGTHHFKVEVSNGSGEIITTRDFDFNWDRASISRVECFLVRFPIRRSETLTFSLYLNGDKQREIKFPIRVRS
jgi:hypothetical protein